MKPSIKRPIALVILLLVGYAHVFAHLNRAHTSYFPTEINGLEHFQGPIIKTPALGSLSIYDVEEDERVSKQISKDNSFLPFSYSDFWGDFFRCTKSNSRASKFFSSISFFGSPYLAFRVLRL